LVVLRDHAARLHAEERDESACKGVSASISAQSGKRMRKPVMRASGALSSDADLSQAASLELSEDDVQQVVKALREEDSYTHATLWKNPRYVQIEKHLLDAHDAYLVSLGKKPPARIELQTVFHHLQG
jgi:carbonic anhydrase